MKYELQTFEPAPRRGEAALEKYTPDYFLQFYFVFKFIYLFIILIIISFILYY